jgi:hypothetical protein
VWLEATSIHVYAETFTLGFIQRKAAGFSVRRLGGCNSEQSSSSGELSYNAITLSMTLEILFNQPALT